MKNNLLNKKFLMLIILLFFIILLVFLGFNGYSNLQQNKKIFEANTFDTIDQRLSFLYDDINYFPIGASDDILFLSKTSSMRNVINSGNENLEEGIKELENDFLEFLKGNDMYYKLRYIDENGEERLKVYFDGNDYITAGKAQLENKKGRYYFGDAMNLDEEEVFISIIDLNFEKGVLENRGTESNPEYVPVIRFATPVFSNEGGQKGIIISSIYADYFLEDIRRAQREGETVVLIEQDGYYLSHPEKDKEFAFMLENNNNFYEDYQDIADQVISLHESSFKHRRIESGGLVFSLRHIHPASASFELFSGSRKVLNEADPDKEYFWNLISISEKEIIDKTFKDFEKNYFFFLLFLGIIVFIIIVLVFLITFKITDVGGKK